MKPSSWGEHQTQAWGAPVLWDSKRQGACGTLSVCDVVDERGNRCMLSRWDLEPGDVELLTAGAPVILSIMTDVHPVVSVFPGNPETSAPPEASPLSYGLPATPAAVRDLLQAIMAQHERTTCSPEATALGQLLITMISLAQIATPGDPNGRHRAEFLKLNLDLPVGDAERCRAAFEPKSEGTNNG